MRPKISLPIDGKILKKLIQSKTTIGEISKMLDLSRQTLSKSLSCGEMSPRTVSQVSQLLKLTGEEVSLFLKERKKIRMTITVEIFED
jgi:DNA-binding transcriptional ArsR family regulator